MNSNKELFYESFAEDFDGAMNMYDTKKRVHVIFNELLTESLQGKKLLDAGCGTGWFSQKAVERGAITYSMDLGDKLLAQVKKKCQSNLIKGSVLSIPFEDNFFDVVISSEVIEHTPDPLKAISEFRRVLKPGGILVVTTPNRRWKFSLMIANLLNVRPYQGLENWVSIRELKMAFQKNDLSISNYYGIHLFPFIFSFLNPVLNFFHRYRKILGPFMVNIAIKGVKQNSLH